MQPNAEDVIYEREDNYCFIRIMFNSQCVMDAIHEDHWAKVNTPGCQLFLLPQTQ